MVTGLSPENEQSHVATCLCSKPITSIPRGLIATVSGKILGKVTEITPDGDLLTDVSFDQLANVSRAAETRIVVDDEFETFGIFGPEHGQPAMTLIAILEEGKPLRMHLVSDSASIMLGVRQGAPVEIKW